MNDLAVSVIAPSQIWIPADDGSGYYRYVLDTFVPDSVVVEGAWAFPIGTQQYPPARWYAASIHDLTGKLPQPVGNPRRHSGIDLNLDVAPHGDVERGFPVYAVTDGAVTYVTEDWGGAGMVVVKHACAGIYLYARYAHITPTVTVGEKVSAGQQLGTIADWKTGDHLHFDMAYQAFTREYLTADIGWVDPVPILRAKLDADTVDAMLRRGN